MTEYFDRDDVLNDHLLNPVFDVDAAEIFVNEAAQRNDLPLTEIADRLATFARLQKK